MEKEAEFILAAKSGDMAKLELLLAESPALANSTESGVAATMLAVYHGHPEAGRLIVRAKTEPTVFEAAAIGDVELLSTFLTAEPEFLNSYSPDGFTAMGFGAYFGHLDVVGKLLARSANPNLLSKNALGVAPLHSALAGGHSAIALLLLQGGADVNLKNGEGWTPLHYCSDIGDAELAVLMLEKGASNTVRNNDGKTPAEHAADVGHEHVAESILEFLDSDGSEL